MSKHTCHWPGCEASVPPSMWGCRPHWFKLPKFLRDAVWRHYRPGQEITKTPSGRYVAVARIVQLWCEASEVLIAGEPITKEDLAEVTALFRKQVAEAGL